MNGRPVKDGDDLVSRVSGTPIGNTINITVDREGKRVDTSVVIGDREEQRATANPGLLSPREPEPPTPEQRAQPSGAKFGLRLRPTSDAEREAAKIESGVVVTTVDADSFAEEIGLQERDIIASINRTSVASVDDVRKLQGQLKTGDPVTFLVMRPAVVSGRDGRITSYTRTYLAGAMPGK
jgi:serine protease Do